MKRAACYVRVSTEQQTVANQRAAVENLCRAHGFEPVFFEETESGAKTRPVWERVKRAALDCEVSAVVVWALDRTGRRMAEIVADVTRLNDAGVPLLSVRETWLNATDETRGLLISIFAWLAEFERKRLIERTRAGIDRARRDGTRSGKAIGRPSKRRNILVLAGVDKIRRGETSIATAAHAAGVSEKTMRRALKAAEGQNPPPPPTRAA